MNLLLYVPIGVEIMVNIEFNNENIEKCQCPCCPVQGASKCAYEQLEKVQKINGMPNPEEVPGIYCISGKTTCEDFNQEGMCQCSKCELWKEYNLGAEEPGGYFCARGKSRPQK